MKHIYLYITATILLCSCVEETKLNYDQLVVNAFFSDKHPLSVHTSKTSSIFDTSSYQLLPNLEAKLYEEGVLVKEFGVKEKQAIPGYATNIPKSYSTNHSFRQGKRYKIEYIYDGKKVSSEDVIPKSVPFEVTKSQFVNTDNNANSEKAYECTLEFKDPSKEKNYYIIAYNSVDYQSKEDKVGWSQALGWMSSDDPAIEKEFYHTNNNLSTGQQFIFSDKYFEGQKYSMRIRFYLGLEQPNKGLRIYFISISESYYNYMISYLNQKKNNQDYYAEPTQVYNNIQNGFGIFAGFSFHHYLIKSNDL